MISAKQTTLRTRATLSGAGVHSNAPVQVVLHPAEADSGVVFLRTGLPDGQDRTIRANWSKVSMTELCTVIGDASDATVATIEHLLAALAGLGVDNVLVEIDGPEVPIMDGSAAHFVEAIDQAGVVQLSKPRRFIKVLKTGPRRSWPLLLRACAPPTRVSASKSRSTSRKASSAARRR